MTIISWTLSHLIIINIINSRWWILSLLYKWVYLGSERLKDVPRRYFTMLPKLITVELPLPYSCRLDSLNPTEYSSGLSFLPPGDLPNPGIKPMSLMSPALAGGFLTTSTTWGAPELGAWSLSHWTTREVHSPEFWDLTLLCSGFPELTVEKVMPFGFWILFMKPVGLVLLPQSL